MEKTDYPSISLDCQHSQIINNLLPFNIRLILELFDAVWNEQEEVIELVIDLLILSLMTSLECLWHPNWGSIEGNRPKLMTKSFSEGIGLAVRSLLSAVKAALHLIFPHNLWLAVWVSNRAAISSVSPSTSCYYGELSGMIVRRQLDYSSPCSSRPAGLRRKG